MKGWSRKPSQKLTPDQRDGQSAFRRPQGAATRRCGIVARSGGPDLATKLSWGISGALEDQGEVAVITRDHGLIANDDHVEVSARDFRF